MKGDAEVLDLLDEALTNEVTALNQDFHARTCENWGYLARQVREEE